MTFFVFQAFKVPSWNIRKKKNRKKIGVVLGLELECSISWNLREKRITEWFFLFFELGLKSVLRSPMPGFSQKKAFFFIFSKKLLLYFQKCNPALSGLNPQNISLKNFLFFPKKPALKKSLIFYDISEKRTLHFPV